MQFLAKPNPSESRIMNGESEEKKETQQASTISNPALESLFCKAADTAPTGP